MHEKTRKDHLTFYYSDLCITVPIFRDISVVAFAWNRSAPCDFAVIHVILCPIKSTLILNCLIRCLDRTMWCLYQRGR
jgi:hypothetical protein